MLLNAAYAYALKVPELKGRVNDYAGLLTPAVRQGLDTKLAEFERTDSTQVVVLTVTSLEGDTIEDFSIHVAEAWKIGQAGKDNGVLFTVVKDDRKMRIEVGKGLEGPLTDLLAGRILDNTVRPLFKAGDYDGGVSAGVKAIIAATRGEYQAEETSSGGNANNEYDMAYLVAIIVVAIIGRISKIAGTLAGAVALPVLANAAYGVKEFIFIAMLAGVGALIGLALAMFTRELGGRSRYSSSSSSSGSSFSGGGGSFGGGGSSSSW